MTDLQDAPTTTAATTHPRVLVIGPRARARGGIGSVQDVLERHLPAHAELAVVTTHTDSPDRLRTMVRGTLAASGQSR